MIWRKSILMVLFALGGCSSRVEISELPDSYEFALDGLRQVVIIGGEGRYTNTLYKGGEPVWSYQQSWTYEDHNNRVTLTGFRFGIPDHSASPGLWFVMPRKTIGGIKELCFDADLGRCFSAK